MDIKKFLFALLVLSFSLTLNTAYSWTINMDFNQGQLGRSVEDRDNGHPVFTDAAGNTLYDACSGIAIDGQCAKLSIDKGHDGWGTWGGRIHFSELGLPNPVRGTEVWYSIKIYFPVGFDYTASPHLKFMRLHTTSAATQNEGYNDLYITPDGPTHWNSEVGRNVDNPFFFIKEGQNRPILFGDFNIDKPKLGTWETYEVYLKLDNVSVANGGTSRVRVWKNGKLLAELNDIQTLTTNNSYADAFLLFTYWNGGNPSKTGSYPSKTQSLYVDDLVVTTDRPAGRDSLGNAMIGDIIARPNPPTALNLTR